jgi:pilus assembly protein CpaB
MLLRLMLLALLGLGIAGIGTVAWLGLSPSPAPPVVAEAPAPPPPMKMVLVAAHPMRAGTLVKDDDLAAQPTLTVAVPVGARLDTPADRAVLAGAMIRQSVVAGQVLLPAAVLHPGDHGFLAAVLHPGMRATTVGVDPVTGTAGLIWPGDQVDLILTQTLDDASLAIGHRTWAETVLGGVRVIAIDQHLMQGAVSASPETGTTRTVTLEVTPEQAERVAVAARLGRLSLAVCSPEPGSRRPASDRQTVTWGDDVSSGLKQDHDGGRTLRLFRGAEEGKEFRF